MKGAAAVTRCTTATPDQARGCLGRPRLSSRAIRAHLRRRRIRTVIPQPPDQMGHRQRRGRLGDRPPGFDHEAYKQHNTDERCISRLKKSRGLATRSGKLAIAYQAASTSRACSSGPDADQRGEPRQYWGQ